MVKPVRINEEGSRKRAPRFPGNNINYNQINADRKNYNILIKLFQNSLNENFFFQYNRSSI